MGKINFGLPKSILTSPNVYPNMLLVMATQLPSQETRDEHQSKANYGNIQQLITRISSHTFIVLSTLLE